MLWHNLLLSLFATSALLFKWFGQGVDNFWWKTWSINMQRYHFGSKYTVWCTWYLAHTNIYDLVSEHQRFFMCFQFFKDDLEWFQSNLSNLSIENYMMTDDKTFYENSWLEDFRLRLWNPTSTINLRTAFNIQGSPERSRQTNLAVLTVEDGLDSKFPCVK